MRRLFITLISITIVAIGASPQSPPPNPSEKVVDQLWRMAAAGDLLTTKGWNTASRFFTQPSSLPERKTIRIVSNSYGVASPQISGNTAKLIVWCEDVGKIDPEFRFTPAPPSTSEKTGYGYSLILSPSLLKVYGPDGKTLISERKGLPEWRIAGPQGEAFTTVNTAIRYVLENGAKSKNPLIKKNAEETIAALLKYH
jgi:hypothetical protein